ncbi:MAG: alkaline phosphatase family protein, partial [Acidobacteria bacterium]|nr:alkaline phosphatase family protein [Acidobacteriota bacterium]
LLGAVALLAPGERATAAPGSLPMSPGERVVLIGVDGVLPDEIDYLLAHGDLPNLAERVRAGGVVAAYRRPAEEPPAAFWTTVATGLAPAQHGVVSLDTYRPLGVTTPLARSGPWRAYWRGVEAPIGLAEYRPLLAHGRRAPAVWELAARGGAPVAALGWWATYPAEPLPGLVLAHDAYHLLLEGAPGAVAPEERRPDLEELARATEPGPFQEAVASALPETQARGALDRALLPDRFLREVARREGARQPKVLALYQPAADLLAEGWTAGELPLEYLLRLQLVEIDALVGELAEGVGTLVVLFDPGRRGSGEGRAVVWRGSCTAGKRPQVDPRALGSGLLRAAGMPQSRELPPPPDFCFWPPPPATVDRFGARELAEAPEDGGTEYLESLRSLGYL